MGLAPPAALAQRWEPEHGGGRSGKEEVGREQRSEVVRGGAPARLGGSGGPKASWRRRRGSARKSPGEQWPTSQRGGGSKVLSRVLPAWEQKRTWPVRSEPTGARSGSPRALTWALGLGSATHGRPEWV
jgi:hypothetical protein